MDIKQQQDMTAMQMIKAILKEKKIKQCKFAQMIGKSPTNLSSQMRGEYLKAEDWRKWADVLGYNVLMIPKNK